MQRKNSQYIDRILAEGEKTNQSLLVFWNDLPYNM